MTEHTFAGCPRGHAHTRPRAKARVAPRARGRTRGKRSGWPAASGAGRTPGDRTRSRPPALRSTRATREGESAHARDAHTRRRRSEHAFCSAFAATISLHARQRTRRTRARAERASARHSNPTSPVRQRPSRLLAVCLGRLWRSIVVTGQPTQKGQSSDRRMFLCARSAHRHA